ncbi:MAG TPA: DUF1684 domain-containing protein [Candidatus Dormibacteraeota bacterium]|nr:DUF1684 domain-containing protein [Candidatus Dormibacteraeota bacterium]
MDGYAPLELLDLADWRRRVAELYAEVRRRSATDPEAAWRLWRTERERLYRDHPQSPVPAAARASFVAVAFPYDPRLRLASRLVPGASPPETSPLALPSSGVTVPPMRRLGTVELSLPGGPASLSVFWLQEYSGGVFIPFRDATSGVETYGAGRYLLDTAKGADLGLDHEGRLILDLNFAYLPSCAFDPRWACPLAPPENRIAARVEAGERIA